MEEGASLSSTQSMGNDRIDSIPFIYYLISLIAAIFVGIDVGIVSYLYTYKSIHVLGGLFIATSGFLLNTYVYFESGPESIKDLINSNLSGLWPKILDVVSILGGILVAVFTISAYAKLALDYAFLQTWFIPFFVCSMCIAYGVATFALNKIGLFQLLKDHETQKLSFSEQLSTWVKELKAYFKNLAYDEQGFNLTRCLTQVCLPLLVATVVTYAYTSVFVLAASTYLSGLPLAGITVPLIWLSAIAFFIGELYFNCEQNFTFVQEVGQFKNSYTPSTLLLGFVIFANAVANAFIALDAPLVTMALWGGMRFFCGGLQSFCTMAAKCLIKFPGWSKLTGNKTTQLILTTLFLLNVFAIIYLLQIPYIMTVNIKPLIACCVLLAILLMPIFNYPPKRDISTLSSITWLYSGLPSDSVRPDPRFVIEDDEDNQEHYLHESNLEIQPAP